MWLPLFLLLTVLQVTVFFQTHFSISPISPQLWTQKGDLILCFCIRTLLCVRTEPEGEDINLHIKGGCLEVVAWEFLHLSCLQWDLFSSIIAEGFFCPILQRVSGSSGDPLLKRPMCFRLLYGSSQPFTVLKNTFLGCELEFWNSSRSLAERRKNRRVQPMNNIFHRIVVFLSKPPQPSYTSV